VLVGTTSVETSELLSRMLTRANVKHNVLNAKLHQKEAQIVREAGQPGTVTIATNMAGRGTDILLGGNPDAMARQWRRENPEVSDEEYAAKLAECKELCAKDHEEVIALGGLHILGTERHESRRIDNQLRGRSGRQGDPGSSSFYLSLEDDLLRIFGSERVSKIMDILKIEEGEAITHGMISRAIENAQKKVEAHNFDIRKHLIDYDDVMNKQREVIYTQRKEILAGQEIRASFLEMIDETIGDIVAQYALDKVPGHQWDWEGIAETLHKTFLIDIDLPDQTIARLTPDNFSKVLKEQVMELFNAKLASFGDDLMDHLIKVIMLQTIDQQWKDHLLSIDHLKEGIGLRGYGQKDPKQEYKKEAFNLFMALILRIRAEVVEKIFWVQLSREGGDLEEEVERLEEVQQNKRQRLSFNLTPDEPVKPVKIAKSAGRNDQCPCGSGKKYKQCHGAGIPDRPAAP